MHGELPGAASAFLSVASRVEVATFFRYLREDVSQVDDDDLQAVFQLAFRHLPVLAHRALGRAMSAEPEPMGSPILWDRDRFLERADLQLGDQQLTPSPAGEGEYRDRPRSELGPRCALSCFYDMLVMVDAAYWCSPVGDSVYHVVAERGFFCVKKEGVSV